MRACACVAATVAALTLFSTPASASTFFDPVGDFLPTFAGPATPDLDVRSFSVTYDGASSVFTLSATLAGLIDPATPGFYVIGANTGTGTIRPFAALGQPNVIFNQALVVRKDGTGAIGQTALDASSITISGDMFSVLVPLALLPSTGFAPEAYGFNLWPRNGMGNSDQISDFAPDNATLSTAGVPEPASWALMILGVGAVGHALRRRATATVRFRTA